jgi:beta-glucanase (GH16 family)
LALCPLNSKRHKAKPDPDFSCPNGTCPFTSGLLATEGKFTLSYGYIEMRAQFPAGRGLWPAFWTYPIDNTWPPEIDVVELIGHQPTTAYFNYHWGTEANHLQSQGSSTTAGDLTTGFHTFAADWEPGVITFYLDGVERYRYTNANVTAQKMYLILNLAIGGNGSWPGYPDAATITKIGNNTVPMLVDYVRVYKKVTNGSGDYLTIPAASTIPVLHSLKFVKPGDSDGDGTVSIAEVQSAINMFLGLKTADSSVDQNASGDVSIAEVQKVINSFLGM